LLGLEAKKLNGLKISLDRSRRTVLRATFFFFGSVGAAAGSVDSGAASVIVVDIDGGSDATRDGRSGRTASVDGVAAAVTIMGGGFVATADGRSERAVSVGFGAAATIIGSGFVATPEGWSERAVSLDFAAAAVTGADVGGFSVTRARLTSCAILAGEGW
jgi:hypothetical protein